MTWAYRLLIPKWRTIGEVKKGNESVHESAYRRLDDVEDYKPKNLMAHIQKHGRE